MVRPIAKQDVLQQAQLAAQRPVPGAQFGQSLRTSRGQRSDPGRSVSLLHAQRLATWAPLIKASAARNGVPIELVCGVMLQESGGNPKARSHCGATGLMQLMPATAKRMGVTDIWNPAQNIEGGVRYLRYLTDYFRGDPRKVVAAYNAGEGNVSKYGGVPPFKETQNYVPAVLGFAQSIGGMLRGAQPMRQMIRATMPRHAIANFPTEAQSTAKRPMTPTTAAQRLARM